MKKTMKLKSGLSRKALEKMFKNLPVQNLKNIEFSVCPPNGITGYCYCGDSEVWR